MEGEGLSIVYEVPTEILIIIFRFLNPKSLLSCRGVCTRWKQILDDRALDRPLWQRHCEADYSPIYQSVCLNSIPGLSWYCLYKSITLWARLADRRDSIYEFSVTTDYGNKIINFHVLRDAIIGVIKENDVVYYNVLTLQQIREFSFAGNCLRFSENGDTILLYNNGHELIVRRNGNRDEDATVFNSIKLFLILENSIYYVTFTNTVHRCTFVNGRLICTRMENPEPAAGLCHDHGVLHIFTPNRFVSLLTHNALRPSLRYIQLGHNLQVLRSYHFDYIFNRLECLDNRELFSRVKNVQIIGSHDPALFAGYRYNNLRNFRRIIDLLGQKPFKVFYLFGSSEDRIINIDIINGTESLLVFVTIPQVRTEKLVHPLRNLESVRCSDKTVCILNEPSTSIGIPLGNNEKPSIINIEDSNSKEAYSIEK